MSKFTVRATGIVELDRVQYAIRAGFDLLEQQLLQNTNGGNIPGGGGANPNGYFVVTRALNAPLFAFNLGGLTSGVLQQTVATSISTPSALFVNHEWIPFGNGNGATGTGLLTQSPTFRLVITTPSASSTLLVGDSTVGTGGSSNTFAKLILYGNGDAASGQGRILIQDTLATHGPDIWLENDMGLAAPVGQMWMTGSAAALPNTLIIGAIATGGGVAGGDTQISSGVPSVSSIGPLSIFKKDGGFFLYEGLAAVSAVGTSGLRANASTHKLQYSENGGAWTDISAGSGGITALTGDVLATGPGSAAATVVIPATRIPFGDGSNHMTTSANLLYNAGVLSIPTDGAILVHSNLIGLPVTGGGGTTAGIRVSTSSSAVGNIAIDQFYFGQAVIGWTSGAMSDLSLGVATGTTLRLQYLTDAVNAGTDAMTIDGATGAISIVVAATVTGVDFTVATGRIVMSGGSALAVSSAGTGAFRYDNGTNKLQFSNNGGSWTDIGTGSGSGITGTLTAGRVTLSTGTSTVGDDANLTYATGTGILQSPLVVTNTVGGFGGGGTLSLENNHASPATTLGLSSSGATMTGGLTYSNSTGTLRIPAAETNSVTGFGGGGAIAIYNNVTDDAHLFLGPGALAEVKGDLFPSATGTYKNGTSAKIWSQIYATTHYAGTVTGFGGGGTLTIQNNDASPVTSVTLDATLVTVAGGSLKATGAIGVLSNTVSGFGGGGTLTIQNNDVSAGTVISLGPTDIFTQGNFNPAITGTYTLGYSAFVWNEVWGVTHLAGTVAGFGGGGVLTLQNNNIVAATSIDLGGSDIQVKGDTLPKTTNTYALGSSSKVWSGLWTQAATITGMTAGSALFAGASGIVSQNNNNFFWDDTNKRLVLKKGGAFTPAAGAPLTIAAPSGVAFSTIAIDINNGASKIVCSDTGLDLEGTSGVTLYGNGNAGVSIDALHNAAVGTLGSIATTATDGFAYIPSCAGPPTGTPTSPWGTSSIPLVIDRTNNKLYGYIGGSWRII